MSLKAQGLCPWILLVAGLATVACESALPVARDETPRGAAILIVGSPTTLNASEAAILARLEGLAFEVEVQDDGRIDVPGSCGVVIVSKTVSSTSIGNRLQSVACGVVFWEDNIQMLGMMATIDNDGSGGTSWHSTRSQVIVSAEAPAELRGDLAGTIEFYTQPAEVTFAPAGDLPPTAIVVALVGSPAFGRTAVYAYERGATLADGTAAAGRRVFFGLYDDTFRFLTPSGLALFDRLVGWAAGS